MVGRSSVTFRLEPVAGIAGRVERTVECQLTKKMTRMPTRIYAQYWDFKEEDTKEFTHGIHNYPAMMVCPISRNIIKTVRGIQPVTALFDPFAGSGTVLVEGMLAGIPVIAGNDLNPFARFLSGVKTTPLAYDDLVEAANELLQGIVLRIKSASEILNEVDSYI